MISLMRDPKDLASAIKKLRGERIQKDLAEKAGFDPSTWSAYEKGDRLPRTQSRFEKIARSLGCTPERLDEVMWECRNERVEEDQARAASPTQAPTAAPSLQMGGADPRHSAIRTGFTNIRQGMDEVLQALEDVLLLAADPKSPPS
jgi:transcriptional regulator with XRE-family HTH domain